MKLPPVKVLIKFICFFSLLSFWLAPQKAQAQQTQTRGNEFRLSSFSPRVPVLYYYQRGSQDRTFVRATQGIIRGPYRFRRNHPIEFWRDNEEGIPELKAIVTIPEEVRQPLVLLFDGPVPGPDGVELPFGTMVFDDSRTAAPIETVRFINLSNLTVAVSFNSGRPLIVGPRNNAVVAFEPPPPDDSYVGMRFAFSFEDNDSWVQFGVNHPDIYLEANARYMVFMMPDPNVREQLYIPANSILVVSDLRRIPEEMEVEY